MDKEQRKKEFLKRAHKNKTRFELHQKLIKKSFEPGDLNLADVFRNYADTGIVSDFLLLALMDYAESYADASQPSQDTGAKEQPAEIEKILNGDDFKHLRINDGFGWTGEWRMSAKGVIDLLIEINAYSPPPMGNVPTEPRTEVKAFAEIMEQKLKENDHKNHWSDSEEFWLFERLKDEAKELKELLYKVPCPKEDIQKECADIANFAMMIADNVKTLALSNDNSQSKK